MNRNTGTQRSLIGRCSHLAFRQFEAAGTLMFDRPAAGRALFEGLIRDHLDVGRPNCVSLTCGRKINARTPGAFRAKVVTEGVDPQISCYYKASRMKQYFKAHRALRTETVICDTRDFGIGRRVCLENWNALRAAGKHASRRPCDAEAADAQPAPDTVTFRLLGVVTTKATSEPSPQSDQPNIRG